MKASSRHDISRHVAKTGEIFALTFCRPCSSTGSLTTRLPGFSHGFMLWTRNAVRVWQAKPGSRADIAAFAALEPHPRTCATECHLPQSRLKGAVIVCFGRVWRREEQDEPQESTPDDVVDGGHACLQGALAKPRLANAQKALRCEQAMLEPMLWTAGATAHDRSVEYLVSTVDPMQQLNL